MNCTSVLSLVVYELLKSLCDVDQKLPTCVVYRKSLLDVLLIIPVNWVQEICSLTGHFSSKGCKSSGKTDMTCLHM